MSEMMDRLTKAIDAADKAWWGSTAEPKLSLPETLARAAIEAMREPTVEMLVAAQEDWMCVRAAEERGDFIWRAMQGKKKGPTAWVRKAIDEWRKGKTVVLVYPVDKWLLMLVKAIFGEEADIRNLGDVKWIATEDRTAGKGTGRHIACFVLRGSK